MQYPENFSRFYDTVYNSLRHIDRDFYLRKIKESKGTVLEIGAGTGRFFLEALKAGADISGIDVSENMLRILKSRLPAQEHHRIFLMDALAMRMEKKFDLIIAPFRMFSHVISISDQLQFLNNVHAQLDDGGAFIFDLFVPDPKFIREGIKDSVDFDGEYEPGKKLRRTVSVVPDAIHQINHVTMKLEWDEDGTMKEESFPFQMRYFYHYELEHLIARSRLKLEKIYGDYEEGELTNESKDFIIVCKK
jgi:cyclopropane fatty-acyl-phospholipid synthase-like methyltransferase